MQTPAMEPSLEVVADSLLVALDLMGVFVFALSGALLAVRKRFDVFGVAVLALAAALGGGILRDLLIGAIPPVALMDWRYGAVCVVAAGAGFVGHHALERIARPVRVFDAIGLGFFAVAGTSKALAFDLPAFAAVAMGVLTAVGGGVLRDVLAGEVPLVLRREIYAVAALAGAVVVAVAAVLDRYGAAAATIATIATVALRLTAVWRRWDAPQAPRPPD